VARQVGARQTWFIHIAHDVSHAPADADLPDGINLAYDGLVLSQGSAIPHPLPRGEGGGDPKGAAG
jgi:hypothetical protein